MSAKTRYFAVAAVTTLTIADAIGLVFATLAGYQGLLFALGGGAFVLFFVNNGLALRRVIEPPLKVPLFTVDLISLIIALNVASIRSNVDIILIVGGLQSVISLYMLWLLIYTAGGKQERT